MEVMRDAWSVTCVLESNLLSLHGWKSTTLQSLLNYLVSYIHAYESGELFLFQRYPGRSTMKLIKAYEFSIPVTVFILLRAIPLHETFFERRRKKGFLRKRLHWKLRHLSSLRFLFASLWKESKHEPFSNTRKETNYNSYTAIKSTVYNTRKAVEFQANWYFQAEPCGGVQRRSASHRRPLSYCRS